MAKVFISYSRDSQDIVEELVQDLNDDGHETWFDQRLTGGQKWWDTILSEIRQCDIFAAALTPDSVEFPACQRELDYANLLQKPVLPVALSDQVHPEALAHGLAEVHNLVYRRGDKRAFKNLQRAIKKLPEAKPLPDPLPDPPPVPMSYLSTLREQIGTGPELTPKDQSYLVSELRSHFRDGGRPEEIIELLQRLKRRRELRANVALDIDELLGDISRGQRDSPSSKGHIVSNDTPTKDHKDQVREAAPDDGTGREIKLDSAAAECRRLLERVLNKGECWEFEIDPKNRFIVKSDASAATPCIRAKACLVDTFFDAKAIELKALGWTVDSSKFIRGLVGGAANGLTFGLICGVRDFMNLTEANRSWVDKSPKDAVTDAAADLTLALRSVAPKAKTIIVRRQEAETQA